MAEEFVCFSRNVRRLDYEGTTGQWRETPLATFHVATTPFAQGALRAAYRAFVSVDLNDPLVAKRFLVESPDNERTYRLDVAQQMTAHAIGEAYNSYKPPKLVKMIPAFLVVVCDDEGRERTYACEKALAEGTFVKHNDNAGFVEQSGEARNTPHALSHFSWESSKKTLLIADVQGVGDSYTDPGIQSLDRRFGYTDLGPVGVAFFFSTHQCNPICQSLGLRPFDLAHGQKKDSPSHFSMRKGKTLPSLTHALKREQTERNNLSVPRLPSGLLQLSSHLLLDLPTTVPMQPTAESVVHLALGILHETGRLATLNAALKAAAEGKETYADTEAVVDKEAAFYHYQRSAQAGNVEAMMICALVHSGFQPRDYLTDLAVTDPKRALFYLELAAQRNRRSALLHLGELRFAHQSYEEALGHFEAAMAAPKMEVPKSDDEDTLGLLRQIPQNVWDNTVSNATLWARMAECYEHTGQRAKAAEFYTSASEEALCDPLNAKQGMKWAEKAAALE